MPTPKDEGIDAASLRRILDYNSNTGIFIWREYRGSNARPGIEAGYYDPAFGYHVIRIDRIYLAHRLAWLHYYGEWPHLYLDHINGIGNDNRIVNLREVTKTENSWNSRKRKDNASGYRGVSIYKKTGKWRARITVHKKEHSLGYFDTKEEAEKAYKKAAKKFYGEFGRY